MRSLLANLGRAGVFGIDRLLRRRYGVFEFSRTDDDLLRISISAAGAPMTLADGTRIMPGDSVVDLHIWNERVPLPGAFRPGLMWASRARRRIARSLIALARHLEQHDELDRCVAVRAVAIFVSTRAAGKVARIAARFGMAPPLEERRADLGHGLLAFGLAWAYNPDSLVGKRLRPVRYEFWTSSRALRERYLPDKAVGDGAVPVTVPLWMSPPPADHAATAHAPSRKRAGSTIMPDMDRSDWRRVPVWDAATRLFHWLTVALVAACYVTFRLNWMDWHAWAGEALLALLLFRLLWGVFGSDTARFARFLTPPAAAMRHLMHLWRREPDTTCGHNPAGGWMVVVMLAMLLGQTLTGLYENNDIADEGPLTELVPAGVANAISDLHTILWDLLLVAIALHVLAIVTYAVVKRHNLLRPMLTGHKRLPTHVPIPRTAHPARAAALLAACAAVTILIADYL